MAVLIKHNSRLAKRGNMLITRKIVLPAMTLRFRFSQSTTDPTSIKNGGTWARVAGSSYNDWDWTCNNADWSNQFLTSLADNIDHDIKIIAAGDTSGVTNMMGMFFECLSLTSVSVFDTSSVTNMEAMFFECTNLKSVPLFDVSNATNMKDMFNSCTKVESGALALYKQASKTGSKVTSYTNAFKYCGSITTAGQADLQQIPADWGGLAAG